MKNNNIILMLVVVVVVGAAAFFGGMQYQKSKALAGNAFFAGGQGGNNGPRRFGGQGGRGGAVIGDILSSDANSITVKLGDGSSKIVILSSNTSINKAARATKSDLTVGAKVAVFGSTNSDGSVTAQNIQLNPMIRNGGGPRPSVQPAQ